MLAVTLTLSLSQYHQLAGIGSILGKYTTQAASYETLLGVRSVMEDMSSLLSRLGGVHTDSLTAIGRAHTTLVRYATEVDLYLSLRVEAGGAGSALQGQSSGRGGGDVGPVEPFNPMSLPLDLFEGYHFEDLFPDLAF